MLGRSGALVIASSELVVEHWELLRHLSHLIITLLGLNWNIESAVRLGIHSHSSGEKGKSNTAQVVFLIKEFVY